jgi:hypothetical protein
MDLTNIKEKMQRVCTETGVHCESIDKLLEEWLKAKQHFIDAFGFNEENDFRWIMKNDMKLEERSDIHSFMKSLACRSKYDIHDFGTLLMGKNIIKLGKVLPKVASRLIVGNHMRQLMGVVGMPVSGSTMNAIGDGTLDATETEKILHKFLVLYGDYVKMGRGLVLSVNPFDMLTASHYSTYKSCMRPGGEYFNGVISHIVSPDVMIAFVHDVTSIDKKIGRQWVYVNKSQYWGGRFYGAYYEADAKVIRDRVTNGDIFKGEWSPSGHGLQKTDINRDADWIYLDYDYSGVFLNKGIKKKNFEINKGPCLSCGKPLDHARHGNCNECIKKHNRQCEYCGEKIKDSELTIWHHPADGSSHALHTRCYETSHSFCSKCKDTFIHPYIHNGLYKMVGGKRTTVSICIGCMNQPVPRCSFCNGNWVPEDVRSFITPSGKKHIICPDCVSKNKKYVLCKICNTYGEEGKPGCTCLKEKIAV